ncbi:MAG TPA: sulfatase [Planctomycetota bacterium]|nr:sulfatase [Planctomycetota bacterium]
MLLTLLLPPLLCAGERPNVLFIAVDDLNDWIGCVKGHPQARTPNIDALAARGTLFTNAHCQAALCNPSRASLLTGLRPSTTGIYGLAPGIRDVEATKNTVSLPQAFMSAGYTTFACGKIYHDGSVKQGTAEFAKLGPAPGLKAPPQRIAKLTGKPIAPMDWGAVGESDEENADYKIASAAIEALQSAPADKPFFIACGFRLPHVPCVAPKKWFDLFPEDKIELPRIMEDDRSDTPRFSWYLHWSLPEPRLQTLRNCGEWKSLVRAYLATTSFMDAQVGRLLDALKQSGRADNTIVVLWSDHGWHLGEKAITGKNTLWERATRVPLIFAGPGISQNARCNRPVELLDIYPTLSELCSLQAKVAFEGHSLLPQLKDASAPREWPAITTSNHDNHSVRTERWRYIRYADGSEELYDIAADPNEWNNIAADAKNSSLKDELRKWLPKSSAKPAPGSKHRVLTYDAATGEIVWEGKPIGKDDAVPED